jgi:hypothetical protein
LLCPLADPSFVPTLPPSALPPLRSFVFSSLFPFFHNQKKFSYLFIFTGLTVRIGIDRLVRKFGQPG